MKEITLQQAALAWAQGKRVEAMDPSAKPELWMIVSEIGKDSLASYTAAVFNKDAGSHRFRIAPEPPANRYRPWTPEEVPVGAITRSRVPNEILMIIGRNEDGVRLADDDGWYAYSALVLARTYSTDGGKTWLPCGVEVEA
jgi:hypothetical protein